MLTCKEATQLASQELDRKLGITERVGLRLHLLICSGCRAARSQFGFLRKMAAAYGDHLEADDTVRPKP
jgi:hypothetical protein